MQAFSECNTDNPCTSQATCFDPDMFFKNDICSCPLGFAGDGYSNGTGCYPLSQVNAFICTVMLVLASLISTVACCKEILSVFVV